ncbi:phosphotransferase family protein [Streptomyces bohaiensis]|uniref:Phosphotransferase n=1 Tax=Streptomyces bohaiensis TaxID=1431344 RepID=A0ABX1CBN1_9ACTN|nr:phosphotransferase [Streptomyces bohaiensis]NJQ15055.1 phosphotransferase [Streptomyces bohaiensis]
MRGARSRSGCRSTRSTPTRTTPGWRPRELLRQEARVYRHLASSAVPVPRLVDLLHLELDVLVCEFMEADGTVARSQELGGIIAALHQLPAPGGLPLEHGPDAFPSVLAERIARRWSTLDVPATPRQELPTAPHPALLTAAPPDLTTPSLLHLDVRASNTIVRDGRITALVDWSNSLIGDPALELARIHENARLPENGIDFPDLLRGYAAVRPLPRRTAECWRLYLLDAAVMLAVVFTSEAPDAERGPLLVRRVAELAGADLARVVHPALRTAML